MKPSVLFRRQRAAREDDDGHVADVATFGTGTMHVTTTVDCAVIVSGEIYAQLETGEVKLSAGDTLIQRGTVHGWSNLSSENCIIVFCLIDAGLPARAG